MTSSPGCSASACSSASTISGPPQRALVDLLGEVALGPVLRGHLHHGRLHVLAHLLRELAAGVEPTPGRRVREVRRRAGDRTEVRWRGLDARGGGEEGGRG